MRILIHPDAAAATRATSKRLLAQIQANPAAVLGLATGGTMEPVYADLVDRIRQERLSLAQIRTFNLDEYIGLSGDHPQSYRATMHKLLFDLVDIPAGQTHLPQGDAPNPDAEAAAYEDHINSAGGIDLQLLGIGGNGHIGFNEPSSSLASLTRIKRLSRATIEANSRFFGADETVPTHSITMGISTIMRARKILLLATGSGKADVIRQAAEGPVTASCPASILQFHRDVTLIVDEAAAAGLELREFYDEIHPGGEEVYFANPT